MAPTPVATPPRSAPPKTATVRTVKARRAPLRDRLRRDWLLLLLLVPGVGYFLVFHYGALFGNLIAFKDYVPFYGVWASEWIGVQKFTDLVGNTEFWQATWNTVSISFLQLLFYFPAPLGLALLLHSLTRDSIRRFVQSVVYLPHFISWVIVVALFQQVLGDVGVLNGLLADGGLSTVDIIGNPDAYKPLVIAQVIWKECGWGTIIFLAALAGVNEQLYEAAAIDGAGWWRRTWHVTLPAIRPVIILLLILRLGDILTVGFEQFFLQRNAVGPEAGEVLDTFVYYMGIQNGDFSLGAAAGLMKGVVGLVLVYTANKIAHRLGESGVYKSS
ncbi:ABC transporter permease [Stackebrandtia nassauensis]|uniref:Binding-protein-dependent transport systems inner membrane component n=1 Tax=Stackebrandtia nassauensis (strain DSM 44728 / CIP 108903 / NRRL B-16338 / NBRC 102104 / LLR-40K-21) TaxID=446470 RepID=D3PY54_STANL|nr:ABC transporter permease subunit [Stackebrandtia nassauensis]ADD45383.1 binding-protein-dependent transport systems inner membrane component [Stackebrandtia nassauensis DSM 44728]